MTCAYILWDGVCRRS